MAFVINDRVLETSTSVGTGTFTLAGAPSGFQSFSAGVGANNTTYYAIASNSANEWEVGLGTLDATGTVLTRTTVYKSSNSNNPVVFTAGTKTVFVTYPAEKSVNYDASGNIAITNATVTNTGNTTYSGTALRVLGDFSNTTVNSRLAFQTSTLNSATGIYALPNGSSTAASWQATNTADPTNASKILIATNGTTDVQVVSGINGTGTGGATGGVYAVTITNGGTGYVSGTYTNVPLTGGAGSSAVATSITVTAGVVTAVVLPTTGTGFGYAVGNTLSASNTNLGGTGSGLVLTISTISGYLPLSFLTNGLRQMQIATSGNVAIGTGVAPSATSKLLVNGVIESNSGGIKYPNGSTQTVAYSATPVTVANGYGSTFNNIPSQSYFATFSDVNATTSSRVSITVNAKSVGTIMALNGYATGAGYGNSTYSNVPLISTQVVTISIATPGVVVLNNVLPPNTPVRLTTTGSLPTGLSVGVTYYVVNVSGVTCYLSATPGGPGITTSGTQSGVHTMNSATGTGATATITVATGAVSNVVTALNGTGSGYSYGDVLFVDNTTQLGTTGSGFYVPVGLLDAGDDELEMDGIKVSAYCATAGTVTVFIDASPGYIAGGRNFIYSLG